MVEVVSGHKEIQAHKVHKDHQVVHKVHKDQRVLMDHKVLPVLWDYPVYKDHQGHKGFKVTKDIKD